MQASRLFLTADWYEQASPLIHVPLAGLPHCGPPGERRFSWVGKFLMCLRPPAMQASNLFVSADWHEQASPLIPVHLAGLLRGGPPGETRFSWSGKFLMCLKPPAMQASKLFVTASWHEQASSRIPAHPAGLLRCGPPGTKRVQFRLSCTFLACLPLWLAWLVLCFMRVLWHSSDFCRWASQTKLLCA